MCGHRLVRLIIIVLFMAACASARVSGPPAKIGDPLPGLTPAELARFQAGKAVFQRTFDASHGLGPLFNSTSCAECHEQPVVGGVGKGEVGGDDTEVHASKFTNNLCNELPQQGGPVFRQHATRGDPPPIPADANIGRRTTSALFGFGLIDTIPDSEILKGVGRAGGRAARLPDGRLGRFGRKATNATLSEFSTGAFRVEQGIEVPAELSPGDRDLAVDFMRFLAPPDRAQQPHRGADVFQRIGCADCHTPSMKTGPSSVKALAHKEVPLYSDLLLHTLGPALADLCMGVAKPEEFRTAPLMGLRFKTTFLHDGRALSLTSAIVQHAGQAQPSVDAFLKLRPEEVDALLKFLQAL
ncbi:MAG: hypothetical protein DME05_14240 [Candidatus Rokuibacteriota bacterium]|nr:MAG: hypothetical protein DME05_14240 [Candidatus Rokubacteria bacterium]PYN82344.1 MAG: hypothetical protein DMD97_01205 [Candidatus Rokubacteria bacterium]